MIRLALSLIAVLAAGFSGGAHAIAPEELAKKSGCLACHKVDQKLVGPSYKEVAAKYKDDKGAEAKLIEKVKKGGSGVWGAVFMPPNSLVKDSDIKILVEWVLSQK